MVFILGGVERHEVSVEEKNIERFLAVGEMMLIHIDPTRSDSPRCKTVLRGWRKPTHIIVDRPKTSSGSFAAIQEGQNCVLRFVKDGLACAFDAILIDWDNRRHNPYMRMTWPKQMKYVSFRKYERLQVKISCRVLWPDGTASEASIHDLSLGGCSMLAQQSVEKGDALLLSFSLPDGTAAEGVQTVVRSVREGTDGTMLGCEFIGAGGQFQNDLTFFITSTLERGRLDAPDAEHARRVLVMENRQDVCARIRRNLESKGFDVIFANNAIDGIYRLRMAPPVAVVVSDELIDLRGLELCRMITSNMDFSALPVIVYGGTEEGLAERAAAVGAAAYVPPGLALAPDIAAAVMRAAKRA